MDVISLLIKRATLQAIKTLTTKRALMKSKFFEITNVPHGFSLQKIVSYLRTYDNLNFIYFIHKRLVDDANNCNSWLFGCRNSSEFNQFFYNFKEIQLEGIIMQIQAARRDLDVRHALLNDSSIDIPISLFKMKASSGVQQVLSYRKNNGNSDRK